MLQTLAPGRSYLAEVAGGRQVVLKQLPADCLWKNQLHPNVRERLARVRELAHAGVAVLVSVERESVPVEREPISVQREPDHAWAVWEFVPGQTLETWLAAAPAAEWIDAMRAELTVAVTALHALGIVHGAIHARNCIVLDNGTVKLTHVSPLLHHDPEVDAAALRRVFSAGAGSIDRTTEPSGESERPHTLRRRALAGALAVLLIGLVGAWLGYHALRRANPPPPVPPQADPALLDPATPAVPAG